MIRRFNYTERKRIGVNRVSISLIQAAEGPARFDANIDLKDSSLPPEAAVFLEAHYKSSYMRFACGTVGDVVLPTDRRLTEIDRGNVVLFRLKVVDTAGTVGRIVAELDDLTAEETSGAHAGRFCVLPVQFLQLGQELWRVNLDDRPILEVNNIEGADSLVRRDAGFFALVFPAAIREILTHILVNEGHDSDEGSNWRSNWIRFARSVCDEAPPPVDLSDFHTIRSWVDRVAAAFANKFNACDRFLEKRAKDGGHG